MTVQTSPFIRKVHATKFLNIIDSDKYIHALLIIYVLRISSSLNSFYYSLYTFSNIFLLSVPTRVLKIKVKLGKLLPAQQAKVD